jgi:hypothetical protein
MPEQSSELLHGACNFIFYFIMCGEPDRVPLQLLLSACDIFVSAKRWQHIPRGIQLVNNCTAHAHCSMREPDPCRALLLLLCACDVFVSATPAAPLQILDSVEAAPILVHVAQVRQAHTELQVQLEL